RQSPIGLTTGVPEERQMFLRNAESVGCRADGQPAYVRNDRCSLGTPVHPIAPKSWWPSAGRSWWPLTTKSKSRLAMRRLRLIAEVAGIEPTGRGSPVPLVLKTRGPTRRPFTSASCVSSRPCPVPSGGPGLEFPGPPVRRRSGEEAHAPGDRDRSRRAGRQEEDGGLADQPVCVGAGEQGRRSPRVPEQHRLTVGEAALPDPPDEAGHRLPGVDGVEDQSFEPGCGPDRLEALRRRLSVAGAEARAVDVDLAVGGRPSDGAGGG